MKKIYIHTFIVVLLLCLISLTIGIKFYKKKQQLDKVKLLPIVKFDPIVNGIRSTGDLPHFDAYIIQIFNPDCVLCQRSAQAILTKHTELEDICFIMLSATPISQLKDFSDKYQLSGLDNVILGHIRKELLINTFGDNPIPTSLIYNHNRELRFKEHYLKISSIKDYFDLH